jgi:hypothetical protein
MDNTIKELNKHIDRYLNKGKDSDIRIQIELDKIKSWADEEG